MLWRRKFPRLHKDFRVTYRVIDQAQFQSDPVSSLAVNISGGGVCFESIEPLAKRSLLALEMNAEDDRPPILALVKVAWCKPRGDLYDVGAEFWWVGWRDNAMQTRIADYVASHTAKLSA